MLNFIDICENFKYFQLTKFQKKRVTTNDFVWMSMNNEKNCISGNFQTDKIPSPKT